MRRHEASYGFKYVCACYDNSTLNQRSGVPASGRAGAAIGGATISARHQRRWPHPTLLAHRSAHVRQLMRAKLSALQRSCIDRARQGLAIAVPAAYSLWRVLKYQHRWRKRLFIYNACGYFSARRSRREIGTCNIRRGATLRQNNK